MVAAKRSRSRGMCTNSQRVHQLSTCTQLILPHVPTCNSLNAFFSDIVAAASSLALRRRMDRVAFVGEENPLLFNGRCGV